jgi:MFS superfamily sulfate permease-like transporter
MLSSVLLRRTLTFVFSAAIVIILGWVIQSVPEWQAEHAGVRSAPESPKTQTTPEQVAALENEMRKTLIQMLAGAFALVALYFTFRRLQVADSVHITDRYSKAIEQLVARGRSPAAEKSGDSQPFRAL